MSISPLKSSARQPDASDRLSSDRLTISQALLITAGLAGLIGLLSGTIIRFSLSNSDNARFLSPLQTFPELSNWAPELPQGTADAHYLPGGGSLEDIDNLQAPSRIQTFESLDEFADKKQIDEAQAIERIDQSTFDTFANRGSDARRISEPLSESLRVLQNGPTTLGPYDEGFERQERELSENGDTNSEEEYEDNYPEIEEPLYDDGTYYENQGQW